MDPEHQIRKLFLDKKEECEMEGRPIENILDIDNGYDLKVLIKRRYDKEGKPTNKTTIQISLFGSPKPLTNDPEQRSAWINDEKVWSDVFVAKPYEYLKIILDGNTPWYNRDEGKWVKKIDHEELKKQKEANAEKATYEIEKEINASAEQFKTTEAKPVNQAVKDDDDLPF
jgi:hypothetical protein